MAFIIPQSDISLKYVHLIVIWLLKLVGKQDMALIILQSDVPLMYDHLTTI